MQRRSLTSLPMLIAFKWELLEARVYILLREHWVSICSLYHCEVGTDASCQSQEMNFTSATVCLEHWHIFPWGKNVPPLGQEDPLQEGMAAHSSNLVWKIPWTDETAGLHSIGSHRVEHD